MKRRIARFFAVWLFLGSLFPQTDLEELCKVPLLLVHYQTAHADMSFMTYLQTHYSEDATHSDCAHDTLPMQKHAHAPLSLLFVPLAFVAVLPALPTEAQNMPYGVFRQADYRFQPENALFSPPKFHLI
jgi:hypothetical protein